MSAASCRRWASRWAVATLCVGGVEHVSAQTTTPADGPWSGSAQCVLTAQLSSQGETYLNQQTHTWTLTSTTPVSGTDLKVYASTWKVTGQGTHSRQYGDGRTLTEQWTTAGQAMPDTITIRVGAEGLVHINSGAQARSSDAVNGTSTTHSVNGAARDQTRAIAYYVDEWPFPVVEDAAGKTTISGSGTRAASNVAPGQPPGTTSTAACSWQFVRGAPSAAVPSPAAPPQTPIVVAAVPGRVEAGPSPTTTIAFPPAQATAGPTPIMPTLATSPVIPTLTVVPAPSPTPAPPPSSTTATAAPVNVTTTTPSTRAFTTSGTFTVPEAVTRLTVELWGAGAGGSGAPPLGHGGGGGAYTRIALTVSQGASLRIVIGAGGAGGAAGDSTPNSGMNGADGSSTQLISQGNVLAEADGGKGDGTGGRQSSAPGVFALAGRNGTATSSVYLGSGIWSDTLGAGGPAVIGSVTPVGTAGGGGGGMQRVCYDLYLQNCGYQNSPGAAGLAGYALISY